MSSVFVVSFIAALAGMVTLFVTVLGQSSRSAAVRPFALVVAATGAWLGINLYLAVIEPERPQDYAVWTLVCGAVAAAGVYLVADAMIEPDRRRALRRTAVAGVHPVVMLTIALVPDWHAWAFPAGPDGDISPGPAVIVHSLATVGVITWTLVVVMRARTTVPVLTLLTKGTAVSGWVAPVAFGAMGAAGWGPGESDVTPIGFAVSAVVMWVAVLRPGMLELQPIARDRVFERLADAVFVAAPDGTIVDLNNSAKEMVRSAGRDPDRGRVFLSDVHTALGAMSAGGVSIAREVELASEPEPLIAWITATPITNEGGAMIGSVLQVRDVTEDATYRRELERTQRQLELEALSSARLRAELSRQVVRDANTGLFNRRYVDQTIPVLVEHARVARAPLSVAVIDIDHFKSINDTLGHAAGDHVLLEVSHAMREQLPVGGELARYGGEEFLVMLPGYTTDEAYATIEKMRVACAQLTVPTPAGAAHVTVSAGIATCKECEGGADALVDAADEAMYRAKQGGRNRTELMERVVA